MVVALEHDYRHGFQHVMPKTEPGEENINDDDDDKDADNDYEDNDDDDVDDDDDDFISVNVKSAHGTMIVWLQNDAGYQRWGPTEVSRDKNIFTNYFKIFF